MTNFNGSTSNPTIMTHFRKGILLCLIICIYPTISHAQELFVFRSSDPSPSNQWTTWENIARPWFISEFSQPFDHMTVRVTNVPYGGTYDREFNTIRQPIPWQWIEDLPTGKYDWFARFEYFDGHSWRWSDAYHGPNFYVDRNGPNYLSVSTNGYPASSIIYPWTWTTRSDLTFTWSNPGDPGSGVNHYEVSVNGGAWQHVSSGYSPTLTSGQHRFAFRAVDNLGLAGSGSEWYISVDIDPPTIFPYEGYWKASDNPDPAWTRYADMRFFFNASDIGSGLEDTYISVDEGGFSTTPFSDHWVTVSSGYHTFDFKARDRAGHESTVKRLYARVDTEPPAFSIHCPAKDTLMNSDSLYASWEGSDQFSGIACYTVSLDGASTAYVSSQDTLFKPLSEGEHRLIVEAFDVAGNSTPDTLDFYVDLTGPVITSDHPDLEIPGDEECNIIIADYTQDVIASDDHSAEVTVTQAPAPGTVISDTTLVTLTATDESGNMGECSFSIHTIDDRPPVIAFVAEEDAVLDETCSFSLPDYTVREDLTVTDDCSPFTIVQEPEAGTEISDTTEVSLTVTDAYGNSAEWILTVNANDETEPVIVCVDDREITLESGETEYQVTGSELDPEAFLDNCSSVTLINDLNQSATLDGEVLQKGTTTITWTATDASGNSGTCSMDVTVSSGVGTGLNTLENLVVYPNPTSGKVIVESASVITGIEVTGISGRTLLQIRDNSRRYDLDLGRFGAGMYFLKIHSDGTAFTRMVVKE